MLSKTSSEQDLLDLARYERWGLEGVIEPVPQIAISKEIPVQQSYEVGKRPGVLGSELEILYQEHGDQCCPNLDEKGILGSAHEGLDLEVLFQSLEEKLDLPSVLVYGGYGAGAEGAVIGKQHDLAFLRGIPDHDSPQWIGAGIIIGKENDLIRQDVPVARHIPFFVHVVPGVVLEPGDKVYAPSRPLAEQGVVIVSPIHGDDGPFRQWHVTSDLYIRSFPV